MKTLINNGRVVTAVDDYRVDNLIYDNSVYRATVSKAKLGPSPGEITLSREYLR